MTIQLLQTWNGNPAGIYTLDGAEETRLINLGLARAYVEAIDGASGRGGSVVPISAATYAAPTAQMLADTKTFYELATTKQLFRSNGSALQPVGSGGYLGTVANEAAMLALTAVAGDETYRTDTATVWKLRVAPASSAGNWLELAAGGGGGGGEASEISLIKAQIARSRLSSVVGGRLYQLKANSNPAVTPTAQICPGITSGMVIESIFCVSAGTGALNLHDSTDGALNAAERIFSIASPAANTLYTPDRPLQISSCLIGGQTTLGQFLICARTVDGEDMPLNSSVDVTPVDAAGVVLSGPGALDSIQVVAAGSAGNLILYQGQFNDADTETILTVAFGSLSAGQVIRLAAGPVRLPGLRVAIPTGGQFNFRMQPFYQE